MPFYGETRIVNKYLFLPKTLPFGERNGPWRTYWLAKKKILQIYERQNVSGELYQIRKWEDHWWVDESIESEQQYDSGIINEDIITVKNNLIDYTKDTSLDRFNLI